MSNQYPIIRNKVARAFFNRALEELQEKPQNPQFLNIQCRGYWRDTKTGDWVAFDNVGGEVYIEEFANKKEAVKYASGHLAKTKCGMEI